MQWDRKVVQERAQRKNEKELKEGERIFEKPLR
jgi:hypothetical protein